MASNARRRDEEKAIDPFASCYAALDSPRATKRDDPPVSATAATAPSQGRRGFVAAAALTLFGLLALHAVHTHGGAPGVLSAHRPPASPSAAAADAVAAAGVAVAAAAAAAHATGDPVNDDPTPVLPNICLQAPPLVPDGADGRLTFSAPSSPVYGRVNAMYHQLTSDDYIQQAAERLSSAVQFPTISYDDMRNHTPHSAFALPNKGKDDDDDLDRRRYAPFARFHEWIIKTYPRVHSSLKREVINSYALVYTWDAAEGAPASTDDGKKPLLLMAHMDVVPVAGYPDHVEGWTYPPFSGRIASGRVWGRGSADTKNSLTAILDAVEALLEAEFKPHRPIVIAFGFDEEISGLSGAGHVMPVLAERYGENGFGMVVDEGMGFDPTLSEEARSKGIEMALVAVAEKGYVDLEITLQTPGGHSSLPPDHTGIGLAALFIAEAEKDAPQSFRPVLERDANPFHASLSCVAAWDPGAPAELRDAVANDDTDALTRFVARDTLYQYMIRTSQAIDVISGGAKVNALPERTTFRVNHRVGMHQSTGAVLTRWAQLGTAFANQWQLEFRLLDEHEALPSLKDDGAHRRGLLTVRPLPGRLEPSPTSPAHTDAKYYQMLAGTIRHVFARHPHANVTAPAADEPHVGSLVLVAPTLMPANTDTRFTWSLTPNIFRFSGVRPDASANVHTVDEYMDIRNHAEVIRFYYELIRNWSALK